jgi:hypothetical protein
MERIMMRKYENLFNTILNQILFVKNLLETLPVVPKTKGVRIPITEEGSDEEEVHPQSSTVS